MIDKKDHIEDEIRKAAEEFYQERFSGLFPPLVTCEACGVDNCPNNESCHNCSCQI